MSSNHSGEIGGTRPNLARLWRFTNASPKNFMENIRSSKMKGPYDQNGNRIYSNVRQNTDGTWSVTVWFGFNPATTIRRYTYRTRQEARNGDISDDVEDGVISFHGEPGYNHDEE